MVKGQRALLPPDEEKRLQEVATTGSLALRQRAKVILAWHEGLTGAETAKRSKITENQVRYLWKLYQQKGLDLFMVEPESKAEHAPAAPEPEPGITIADLCAAHHVNMPHAEYVAHLAGQLFDATAEIHQLPASLKPLLEAAALLHDIAYAETPNEHHAAQGRDLILAQPLRNVSDDERNMLACTTAFHIGKVIPDQEPAYRNLPEPLRADTLGLSAILRIADGLDSSGGQSTQIANLEFFPETVIITVEGPAAYKDAVTAQKRADLWTQLFKVRLHITTPAPEERTPIAVMSRLSPTLNNRMTVEGAGQTITTHTLDRIDRLFRQVQSAEVRLALLPPLAREASRLIEAVTLAGLPKPLIKESRWFNGAVEEARILATLTERLAAYGEEAENPEMVADALLEWESQVTAALNAIDTERYVKLAADIRSALSTEAKDDESLIAFHVGEIVWSHMATLRDVMENGTSVTAALEATRRLQDHLIAFRDLLGSEVAQALDMLAPFEGYLSAIQTTQAVATLLEPKPIKKGRKVLTPPRNPALDVVRDTQFEALDSLADGLPSAWTAVNGIVFRRALSLAVATP